jgi:hypothetical protein
MYWHARWPEDLSFTISSLNDPGLAAPIDHTDMADAVTWAEHVNVLETHLFTSLTSN